MSGKMSKKKVLWGAIFASLVGSQAMAVSEVSTYTLDSVLVTAQRTETRELTTPAATVVLNQNDIKKTAATNAFDAVSFSTGMTNFSYAPGGIDYGGMDSRINIRGLERSALIMVNGAPINLNGKNSLSGILTKNIDRIEIVKGAASTLYGAEALGGVVNIITKEPTEPYLNAHVALGNLGYKNISFDGGNDRIMFSVAREVYGAMDQTTPIRKDIGSKKKGYEYYNDFGSSKALNVNFTAKLGDYWKVSYTDVHTDAKFGQPVVKASITDPSIDADKTSKDYHYDDHKKNLTFTYDDDVLKAVVFYNHRDLYGEQRDLKSLKWKENDSNYKAKKYGVDVQRKWTFDDMRSLVAGVFISEDTFDGKSKANALQIATRQNYAVYGSYTHELAADWTAIVGARLQHIADPIKDQDVLIPQYQVLHKINDEESLYLNIGKAFTMPNLSDSKRQVAGVYKNASGKNLKPEEGWNYEVGYKAIHGDESWKIALFHMDFKNFFEWVDDPALNQKVRVNGGNFKNVGIEVDYKKHLSEAATMTVGFAYSNPRSKGMNKTEWEQTYPKLQVNAGFNYQKNQWDFGVSFNWLTKRLQNRDGGINPDLLNLNAYLGYEVDERSSLRLELRNILDRRNVITNGAWEYWDRPFNMSLSYDYRF